MERSRSAYSISSSSSSSTREIEEEPVNREVQEEVEKVYLAVKKEVKEGKPTLLWLLQNTNRDKKKIVITHVHIPAQMIPMMGSKFPASKVTEQIVKEYRQHEREKMHKCLDEYMNLCSEQMVRAEKLVIEADDAAKGLIELIAQHGIAKLIMGAAADKHFSRRMKAPKSKTAVTVKKQADPSCKIWFVCKGTLICTRGAAYCPGSSADDSGRFFYCYWIKPNAFPREAFSDITGGTPSPASSASSSSSQSEQLRSRSLPQGQAEASPSPASSLSSFSSRPEQLRSRSLPQGQAEASPSPASSLSSFSSRPEQLRSRSLPQDQAASSPAPPSSLSPLSNQSEQLRSRSLPQDQVESLSSDADPQHDLSRQASRFGSFNSHGEGVMEALPHSSSVRMPIPQSSIRTEMSLTTDPWDGISRSSESSDHSVYSVTDEILSNSSSLSMPKCEGRGSVMLPLVQESDEDLHFPPPQNEPEDGLDTEVYDRLREAHAEAVNLKHEVYKESLRRQKAEMDAIEALRRAKTSENLYVKEVNRRKGIEEALARERLEVEMLKNQHDAIFEQLQMANDQKLELELRIADSDNIVRDLEEKLLAAQHLLNTLQVDHEELQLQRDAALEEVEELRQNEELVTSRNGSTNFSEFSFSEIELATCNFSDSLKIGEGGYGSVYRGFLRNTTVAIKVLNPQSMQGPSEFHQEVLVLSRVRHPNLVTLIGVCSEARALIYEFLPNGSLEDRLDCKNNTPPLTWQVRTRIAAEICSSLIFLHSNKPHPVVHGDLKPENILLDANLVSKLSDFGVCRLLVQSATCTTTTFCHLTLPKGTFVYMDPEFLATGELTPRSDVYSFGVILLRLLTGKPAFGIVKEVKEALENGLLHEIIDPIAGDWPFVLAKQMAHLGLSCCEICRKNRPDLVTEVWRVLEPMLKTTSLSMSSLSFGSDMDDNISTPNYFICPIFQEIMRDPHIAADGFTYEAEALKGWIESGHKTSPMTNLMLPNCELIPNRALRSAIQEWLQQHPQF